MVKAKGLSGTIPDKQLIYLSIRFIKCLSFDLRHIKRHFTSKKNSAHIKITFAEKICFEEDFECS